MRLEAYILSATAISFRSLSRAKEKSLSRDGSSTILLVCFVLYTHGRGSRSGLDDYDGPIERRASTILEAEYQQRQTAVQ